MSTITPVTSLPAAGVTTGSFVTSSSKARLCVVHAGQGQVALTVLRYGPDTEWYPTEYEYNVAPGERFTVDIPVAQASERLHVLAESGSVPSGLSVNLISLTTADEVTVNTTGALAVTASAATSGVPYALSVTGAADTGQTASTEKIGALFDLSQTWTWATGAITTERAMLVKAPTLAFAGASTVTKAATLAIDNAPQGGTNATITNAYALWVQAGKAQFDGAVVVNSSLTAGTASSWKTTTGALTVDSAAALNLGTSDSTSQSAGKSGTVWTFNGKVAYGATAQTIADPGNAGAIPVTSNGVCNVTTAGAETRTLAIPTFVGQELVICMDTDGGDGVITVASAFNQTGNTVITLNDAGDCVRLVGAKIGGTLRWRLVSNDGATLS